VRALCRTALVGAVVSALLVVPTSAHAADAEELVVLQAALSEATARATALGRDLEQTAGRDGGLRVALERLEDAQQRAQSRLDARVRQVWMARRPDPLGGLTAGLAAAGLRRITDQGAAAGVRLDRDLVDAVAEQSDAARLLRERAATARAGLLVQAGAALEAQDRARVLLTRAEQLLAEQARADRDVAERQDERERAAQAALLSAARTALDAASAEVTAALTPAQTRRSRRAQTDEAPLVALVEAAGSGYPQGYAPTEEVLTGLASWYGPGFVGSPTASGAPYDPERLTCAHQTLRLGTVVRVSANGRAVSCLVNDRGPYVGPRILDMSRAGSRALGYDGTQLVVIEVLALSGPVQSTSR